MFDPVAYMNIIQGSRRGLFATAARGAFSLARGPYWAAVRARNHYYDRTPSATRQVQVPVISVGNITLGGTGKTPFIAWLAKWFRARDVRVALISRGYKSNHGEANDEALELELDLPDVPHLQNTNRYEAASTAVEQFESQLILLDDGFQHRRLHRDLDIVLLDATQPFGMKKLFPRGLLREPLNGLGRAQTIILTRADQISDAQREWIRIQSIKYAPQATWATSAHTPVGLVRSDGSRQPCTRLSGKRVFAFCGIGNPHAFCRTLQETGYQLVGFEPFPDHHHYRRADVEKLAVQIQKMEPTVDAVVCTQKDLVKICANQIASRPLYALAIEIEIQTGLEALQQQLENIAVP